MVSNLARVCARLWSPLRAGFFWSLSPTPLLVLVSQPRGCCSSGTGPGPSCWCILLIFTLGFDAPWRG